MNGCDKALPIVRVRLEKERMIGTEPADTPEKAVGFIIREFADLDREVFMILNLDNMCRPINLNIVSMGTVNAAVVHPREVFKASLLSNASSVICIHNHPGGILIPSSEDIETTRRLRKCGELLGIEVVDHLIIGGVDGSYYSFHESGQLVAERTEPEQEWAAEKCL